MISVGDGFGLAVNKFLIWLLITLLGHGVKYRPNFVGLCENHFCQIIYSDVRSVMKTDALSDATPPSLKCKLPLSLGNDHILPI